MRKKQKRRVFLRACPRCGGALFEFEDVYGPYRSCFQCGCTIEPKPKEAVAA